MIRRLLPVAALAVAAAATPAAAQQIDLSHGGQVTVTALGGFDWNQNNQTVTAYGSAQAVRGGVTVTADRLIAFYRKKAGAPSPARNAGPAAAGAPAATPAASAAPASGQVAPTPENPTGAPPANGPDAGANEVYRLEALGHVHIFTATQQAFGDKAVYDMDQAVMVMTGRDLRIVTPQDVLTARDQMEYWSRTRMSVGRGDAVVTTNDGRRIRADVLVGYSAPPANQPADAKAAPKPAAAAPGTAPGTPAPAVAPGSGQDPIGSTGKLEKVDAFGNVVVRTQTETVRGDRGVYVPDTGIARIVGNVHITRGANQLNGAAAIVNMKTGIATLSENPGARVQGLIVPGDNGGPVGGNAPGAPAAPKRP
ncbi:MAG: hypothetical protein INR65_03415 [Gluconacetobacter diazotrophicus]|nr:hypothetical protein [Gluconacetobacter diazotrophicus]